MGRDDVFLCLQGVRREEHAKRQECCEGQAADRGGPGGQGPGRCRRHWHPFGSDMRSVQVSKLTASLAHIQVTFV